MNNQQREADTTTLTYFLRTGKLGELTIGIDIDFIFNYIGLPDDLALESSKESFHDWYVNFLQSDNTSLPYVNLFYGNLMLTLFEHKVLGMFLYFRATDPHTLPSVLKVNWLETVYQMTNKTFHQYVHEQQIACERIVYPGEEEYYKLFIHLRIPSSNVMVAIDLEDGSDCIYSFDVFGIGGASVPFERLPSEPW